MNSYIIFYETSFPRNENILVDGLEQYLVGLAPLGKSYRIDDFQWIRHDLNITIKIPMDQRWVDRFPYDYCRIHNDDGNPFFYKVTGSNQLAAGTIQISLEMDVVNSLGQPGNIGHPQNFDEETEIIREHEDRFYNLHYGDNYIQRKVDKVSEGIVIDKVKTEDETLYETCGVYDYITGQKVDTYTDTQRWHLIYKSKDSSTDPKPIDLFLCPDNSGYGMGNGKVVQADDIPTDDVWIYTTVGRKVLGITIGSIIRRGYHHPLEGYKIGNFIVKGVLLKSIGEKLYYSILYDGLQVIDVPDTPGGQGKDSYYGNNFYFKNSLVSSRNSGTTWNLVEEGKVEVDPKMEKFRHISGYDPATNNDPYGIVLDETEERDWWQVAITKRYKGFDEINRTDVFLNKIIQLPYVPTTFKMIRINGTDYIRLDNWFINDEGLFQWDGQQINPRLDSKLQATVDWNRRIIEPTSERYRRKARKIERESKLLHSDFTIDKLVYDSFSQTIKPELIPLKGGDNVNRSINIYYKPSGNMNSNILFELQPNNEEYDSDSDYDNLLISTRNNEETLYNSAYINYVENGINFDRKSAQIQTEATIRNQIISGISSVVGIGTSFATGNVLGGVSGIAGAAMNAYQSIQNINDAQQLKALNESRKLSELSQQGVSVSSVNDIDLFDYYGENKLKHVIYKPTELQKHKIADFFHLCGYSHPAYGKPEWNNRVNFNFVQCRPHYQPGAMDKYKKDWLQKLSQCYTEGVTVFHRATDGSYDWGRDYENWETFICLD